MKDRAKQIHDLAIEMENESKISGGAFPGYNRAIELLDEASDLLDLAYEEHVRNIVANVRHAATTLANEAYYVEKDIFPEQVRAVPMDGSDHINLTQLGRQINALLTHIEQKGCKPGE